MAEHERSLAGFQRQFTGYLLQQDMEPSAALSHWLPAGGSAESGMSRRTLSALRVYRNNVLFSLIQALTAQFPIVQRLVGAEFFGALARDYVRQEPPLDASLTYYGHSLAAFIATHPACGALPYLADVAALEFQCQCALHAADDPVLDLQQLGAVPQERLGMLHLVFKAGVSLLESAFPVDRIWAANVSDSAEEIRLDVLGSCHMLVYRRDREVRVVSLQTSAFRLLRQLHEGKCLHAAWAHVAQTCALDATELPALLGYLLGLEIFSGYSIDTSEDES